MNTPSLNEISDAWFAFHRAHDEVGDYTHRTNAGEEFFWVMEYLGETARHVPDACWDAISIIWHRTDKDDMERLADLAAGPLEDLLAYHGPEAIEWVEQLCNTEPTFKVVLQCVWQNAIAPDVWDRITELRNSPDQT